MIMIIYQPGSRPTASEARGYFIKTIYAENGVCSLGLLKLSCCASLTQKHRTHTGFQCTVHYHYYPKGW